jgi:ornithine carbamoyltransferase
MNHFIDIAEHSADEIAELLSIAQELKAEYFSGGNRPLFKGKTLGMIFQKPSLRTRVSFDMAMRHMEGDALYLSPAEIGLGQRESIGDISRVLSGYVSAMMARVFEHGHVQKLAEYASIPVINGLSDHSHPCQAMADALTIIEKRGSMKGLTVCYVGDGNNVAVSLMHVSLMLGANFVMSNPDDYGLPEDQLAYGKKLSEKNSVTFDVITDPFAAVKSANVIYTDTWTSMGQEAETAKREKVFPPYQVNQDLVNAAQKDVLVMHCLPAHRNHEITDEVADGPNSVLFHQAHNRLHAEKAILAKLFKVV